MENSILLNQSSFIGKTNFMTQNINTKNKTLLKSLTKSPEIDQKDSVIMRESRIGLNVEPVLYENQLVNHKEFMMSNLEEN
jgi:hypothetical protein